MDKQSQARTSLMENEHVKELLSIMEESRVDSKDLRELLGHVGDMERQLDAAVRELTVMRRELNGMREDQNHPARAALRNTARSLEGTVKETRGRLASLKNNIIEGCKNAVAAFKEKGVSVLNRIAGFLGIKDGLQNMRESLNRSIGENEKAIAKIEAVSAEFHKTGSHMRNIGRVLLGKETREDVKPTGKLANFLESPYRSELAHLKRTGKSLDAAIGKLEKLERAAERPSVLENMKTLKEQAARENTEKSAPKKQKQMEPGL